MVWINWGQWGQTGDKLGYIPWIVYSAVFYFPVSHRLSTNYPLLIHIVAISLTLILIIEIATFSNLSTVFGSLIVIIKDILFIINKRNLEAGRALLRLDQGITYPLFQSIPRHRIRLK